MKVPVINAPRMQQAGLPRYRESLRPDEGRPGTAVKEIGQAVGVAANYIEKERENADAARAVQEIANFTREADRVMLDPTVDETTGRPVGYKLQQGEDAFGARDAYTKRIQDLVEQHSANLANDRQRAAFRSHAESKVTSYLKEIQAHAGNEAERSQNQAYKIDREVELNHIASFADNPEIRASAIANLRRVALSEAAQRGLKASDQAEWADLAEADANAAAMNSLLSKGNVKEAEAFYAQVKGKLGAQGNRIERYLAEAKAQVGVEVKASEIVKGSILPGYSWINQEKAMATVEAMPPSAEKDRVRTLVEHHISKLEQLRRNTADKKFNQAVSVYELTGTLESPAMAPLRAWLLDPNNASAEYWQRLERGIAAEKRAGKTSDAQERREQMERNRLAMAEFQSLEPGEQVRLDINAKFRGFADQTTLFRLERIQNASKRVVEGGGIARESEFRRFVQDEARGNGLSKENQTVFQMHMGDWRAKYIEGHEGQEPTIKEMREAVRDYLLYGERARKHGFFQLNMYKFQAERQGVEFVPFPKEEQRYRPSSGIGAPAASPQLPAQQQPQTRTLEVPPEDRQQIIEALEATGQQATEDMIRDRYSRMVSRRGG